MIPQLDITGHLVGPGQPCFIIAEAGVNHDGDVGRACALIDAAADAGAHAVKFQTFRTDLLVTEGARKAAYQENGTGADESQADMLRRLELPADSWRLLSDRCRQRGIIFLSTPFDEDSAELLHDLGVPAIKLPSGELTNLPLIASIARRGRPIILSTGMGTLGEVASAVQVVEAAGAPPLALLHCVSDYPTAPEDANLRAMDTLRAQFDVPVGWSDHTTGIDIAIAAVALGATIIEKHFTLDRELPGPDHAASLEPDELTLLVSSVRRVESAMGDGMKAPRPCEAACAASSRRSVVLTRDLDAGTVLTADVLAARRPGTGIPPSRMHEVIGTTLDVALDANTPLCWDHIRQEADVVSPDATR